MPGHLYKRGKIWWGWYYDEAGVQHRKSTHCTDQRAADLVLRGWERSAADPSSVPAHSPTIDQALSRLYADREAKGRSDETVAMYRKKAGHLVRIFGGDTPIARLDARAVDDYVAKRLAEGAARTTLGKELTTIRSMLKVARRRGEYSRDVAAVMPDGFRLEYRPRKTFLTSAQFDALLARLPSERAAHVAWIVATASRWGESLRARREDASLGAGTVRIRGLKTEHADAVIPVVGAGGRLLRVALRNAPKRKPGEPLFDGWGNVRRDLAVACTAIQAGRELPTRPGKPQRYGVTPNDLRRTTATWLRQAGVEPHLIAAVLRHADSRMVERVYGRLPVEDLGAAIRARLRRDTGVIAGGRRRAPVTRPKKRNRA